MRDLNAKYNLEIDIKNQEKWQYWASLQGQIVEKQHKLAFDVRSVQVHSWENDEIDKLPIWWTRQINWWLKINTRIIKPRLIKLFHCRSIRRIFDIFLQIRRRTKMLELLQIQKTALRLWVQDSRLLQSRMWVERSKISYQELQICRRAINQWRSGNEYWSK